MAYKSPEQKAADVLLPLGCIHQKNTYLPFSFVDKEDREFPAKGDFYHPGLDLYIEVKHSHLNGKTSKTKAENAYNRIEPFKRTGRYATHYQIQSGWNHAASKHAIVQSKIGRAQYAIVFTEEPDEETISRIEKQGIQAFSLSRFVGMLQLQLEFETEPT
ncbi:hypothetical protein RCH14_003844 [Massilia sp. MP_M2]|uniref:hypothetical protein n=1 Tax=Massilia sp. MP_M2 TaxID=3071713 RepID=UPI00319E1760